MPDLFDLLANRKNTDLVRADMEHRFGRPAINRSEFSAAREKAEKRFPFIKRFRNVDIQRAKPGVNKGGMGEFLSGGDSPSGRPTITIGEKSASLQGGVADTIIADMVHAAAQASPEFRALKSEYIRNMSPEALIFARMRYERDFKGKFSGSNFSTFENFLFSFWVDGVVQHLLLPENSEIEQIRRANPKANQTLDKIKALFEGQ